ncbi:MAG: molybdopterin-guanine dinucleotide biosynthesis protein B, partial [Deltaproteobacteria bacterium]
MVTHLSSSSVTTCLQRSSVTWKQARKYCSDLQRSVGNCFPNKPRNRALRFGAAAVVDAVAMVVDDLAIVGSASADSGSRSMAAVRSQLVQSAMLVTTSSVEVFMSGEHTSAPVDGPPDQVLRCETSTETVQRARVGLTKPRRLGQGSWSTSVRLVLAICGYSGAGKTTLIERMLPRLAARGLRVGVVKHDSHQLDLDPAGKDTARFFAAGAAAVCAHDPTQHFVRTRESGSVPLTDVLPGLPADLDLVLVEGHKDSALPKLVLEHPDARPTIDTGQVIGRLALGDQRLDQAEQLVASWLDDAWRTRPLGIALFIGGSASDGSGDSASFDIPSVERLVAQLRPCGDRLLLVGGGAESFRPGLSPV